MAKRHVSMRLPGEYVDALDHMADHRQIDRTTMYERVIEAMLSTRQRACKVTHQPDTRCGECGLLSPPANGTPLDRI